MSRKAVDLPFDPDQDPETKRATRQKYRAKIKIIEEQQSNPNDVTSSEILGVVQAADDLFAEVKEPTEALLDSHLLLMASNMGAQKARSMKSGTGHFDVDDFISKLVSFMGGQSRVHQENGDSDEEEDLNKPLEWQKIGLKALAKSRRAPAMSFMLGPLSVEQKKRANVKRAKEEKSDSKETKPQELKEEDIQRSENETTKNVATLSEILDREGATNLFRFVVNPRDFAQTVENIFYLSFLIRDGKVAMETNEEGEPIVFACEPPSDADYAEGLKKQQMVLEFDMATWERAIEVFEIKDSMIPVRPPAKTKLGAWYG